MTPTNRCTGTKKNGQPCGMTKTLRTLEAGYRCRQHRDGLTLAQAASLSQPMPSTNFRTIKDAEKFTRWVLEQGVRGHLNAAMVDKLTKAVREYNQMRTQMADDLMKQYKDLLDRANDELKRLRQITAANIGTD